MRLKLKKVKIIEKKKMRKSQKTERKERNKKKKRKRKWTHDKFIIQNVIVIIYKQEMFKSQNSTIIKGLLWIN